ELFAAFAASLLALASIGGAAAIASMRATLRRQIEDDFARAPGLARARLEQTFTRFKGEVGLWADDPRYASWLGRASGLDAPGGRPSPGDLKAAHDGLGTLALTSWDELKLTNDTGLLLLDEGDQDAVGDDLQGDPAVASALKGREAARMT